MAFIYDLSDTWNSSGTVFNAIKMDVLNIASAAGSRLLSLKIGGVDQAYVDKDGNGYFLGTLAASSLSLVSSLPVTSGGTGVATLTSGYLVKGNGTTAVSASVVYDDGTNVGIGTVPSYKLDVSATGNISGQFKTSGSINALYLADAGTTAGTLYIGTVGNDFRVVAGSNEAMRVTSAGNLLVGTTTGSAKLNLAGSADISMKNTANTSGFDIGLLGGSADATAYIYQRAAAPITFATSNTERARIDSSGNLLVGRTSGGGGRLEVDGNYIRYGNSASYTNDEFLIQRVAAGVSLNARQNVAMLFSTNDTERARIDSSGNLLVGTTSSGYGGLVVAVKNGGDVIYSAQTAAGGYCYKSNAANNAGTYYHMEFQENGTARGTITSNGSAVAYNTTSDARLKENIADADAASSLIDQIKVRKYDWKSDGSHQRYGFIAQELLPIAPEAVSHDPDNDAKWMGVDYSKLVPMLVKEIQSLRARVAQLEGN